jgi:hypothetical protein
MGMARAVRMYPRTGGMARRACSKVDRVRVTVFPLIRGETGEGPVFADLPDLDPILTRTSVIDERLVLLDYRVA